MIYRNLGNTGLPVSLFSYGAWVTFGTQVDTNLGKKCLTTAYESGINFFDNAEAYAKGEAERIMGAAIKELGWARDSYLVSSKVYFGCRDGDANPLQKSIHRKHIVDACHQALERLQVEYIDLYFCHRDDTSVPIPVIVETMTNLIRQGKILYWGTSEWSAQRIEEAYDFAVANYLVPPSFEQPHYNLFVRKNVEQNLAHLYKKCQLGTTIWSPLASGLLTGKYNDGIPDKSRLSLPGYEWLKDLLMGNMGDKTLEALKKLGEFANDLGVSTGQLSLAWCAMNPNVSTVILGASNNEQLVENITALNLVEKLTESDMQTIHSIMDGVRFPDK